MYNYHQMQEISRTGKLFYLLNAEASGLNGFVGASTSAVNQDTIKHNDNPANQAIERKSESRQIEQ